MKKITTIILGALFLGACNDEKLGINSSNIFQETEGIKVNLTIARSDVTDTKATVKTSFADNDVVYIFFKGIAAPKYLEMKYNSSESSWTATAKNEFSASDLSGAADKMMTAIYLPYGNDATVVADDGAFKFQNGYGNSLNYSGYYLQAEQISYTYEANVLSGSISLIACALDDNSDKLIHFDISGFTSGHNYKLYQDHVKPLVFKSVSADGSVSKMEGALGTALTGYEDGSMMSFSGILDASAVGQAVDYQFSIDDQTSSTLYTRDAGTKTLNASKYIGIGAINDSEKWNALEYVVDLGLSVKWAAFNVGAFKPEEYGDYFAWGETEPHYEVGYAQESPQTHWKEGYSAGYSIKNYKYCNGSYSTMTKYCLNKAYGTVDWKMGLEAVDDVVRQKWGGNWQIPYKAHFEELINNCTWTWTTVNGVNGYKVTSKVEGFEDSFIFLPVTGYRDGTNLYETGSRGRYWSGTLSNDGSFYANHLYFSSGRVGFDGNYRDRGLSVRPVCNSNEYVSSLSLNIDSLLIAVGGVDKLVATAKNGNNILNHEVVWSSDRTDIATVDNNGQILAISKGIATITAKCRGKTITCKIKVISPMAVDLGLSVKWASYNVGAELPEEYGDYFAWGEIEPYYKLGYAQSLSPKWKDGKTNGYTWASYRYWISGSSMDDLFFSKYDGDGRGLDSKDDVACMIWKGVWRMPTAREYNELLENCTWVWTTLNGTNGYRVTGKKAGYENRSIFLPASGYRSGTSLSRVNTYGNYWTRDNGCGYYDNYYGYCLNFWNNRHMVSVDNDRCMGYSVRPVCP